KDFSAYLNILFHPSATASGLQLTDPRAIFLTRIASVFDVLTQHNYWLISAWFSFIGFLGAWYLVVTLRRLIPSVGVAAVVAFLFLPSATFWSSGLIKETLAMAGLL